MPMGIDIKAESPEEIAISIAAKIIEIKNSVVKWEKQPWSQGPVKESEQP